MRTYRRSQHEPRNERSCVVAFRVCLSGLDSRLILLSILNSSSGLWIGCLQPFPALRDEALETEIVCLWHYMVTGRAQIHLMDNYVLSGSFLAIDRGVIQMTLKRVGFQVRVRELSGLCISVYSPVRSGRSLGLGRSIAPLGVLYRDRTASRLISRPTRSTHDGLVSTPFRCAFSGPCFELVSADRSGCTRENTAFLSKVPWTCQTGPCFTAWPGMGGFECLEPGPCTEVVSSGPAARLPGRSRSGPVRTGLSTWRAPLVHCACVGRNVDQRCSHTSGPDRNTYSACGRHDTGVLVTIDWYPGISGSSHLTTWEDKNPCVSQEHNNEKYYRTIMPLTIDRSVDGCRPAFCYIGAVTRILLNHLLVMMMTLSSLNCLREVKRYPSLDKVFTEFNRWVMPTTCQLCVLIVDGGRHFENGLSGLCDSGLARDWCSGVWSFRALRELCSFVGQNSWGRRSVSSPDQLMHAFVCVGRWLLLGFPFRYVSADGPLRIHEPLSVGINDSPRAIFIWGC